MIPKLPRRLQTIANMVDSGSVVADVGTDHGYLPSYLIKSGKARFAYAGDIVEGPLNSAKLTLDKYNIPQDKIKLILSDGLKGFPHKCADTILIAGMGCGTIIDILDQCDWVRSENIQLILQPQNKHEDMRRYLYNNGFEISRERAVLDGGHIYVVMKAVYTGDIKEIDDVFAYCGKISEEGLDDNILYIKHQITRLKKQYDGIVKSSIDERFEIIKHIQALAHKIEKILREMDLNAHSE